jgi:phage gp36-like protein
MDYCALADVQGVLTEDILVQLTDDSAPNSTGTVNAAVVQVAIDSAGTTIDAYIGKHFALPLPVVPDVLRRIATDLSVFNLFARSGVIEVPAALADRKRDGIRLLNLIMEGKVSLGLPEGQGPEPVRMVSHGHHKQFPQRTLRMLDIDRKAGWFL